MKFIDLFSGLGGFHVALTNLGHECVFASEKNETLAKLYLENFGIYPDRDITKINKELIPEHDILCAGFPCQPFSKAGRQKGFSDEKNGTLFDHILEILELKRPKYFILENVRNLENHDNGNTWNHIKNELSTELGYHIFEKILSPHHIGIPQHRERFFILGSSEPIETIELPIQTNNKLNLSTLLDTNPNNITTLEEEKKIALTVWQEFIQTLPETVELPSVPIWSMEFGANYPFEEFNPLSIPFDQLRKYKGSFGISLQNLSDEEILSNLPNYSLRGKKEFPSWKKRFIRKNREFYQQNQDLIDPILEKIKDLKISSWQKLEWNIKNGNRNIYENLIQFRGSGIRIKKPDFFPALVTVKTQVPILGWDLRYISTSEAAKLQSLQSIKLPSNEATAYRALGNAVNSDIIFELAKSLIKVDVLV